MYDAMVVEVCNSGEGSAHEFGSVGLVVRAFAADAVEELAAEGEVGDEVDCTTASLAMYSMSDLMFHTVVHGFKIVDKRQNVLVTHRHPLQHRYLIPHHVFPPGHEALVDDLGRIVATCVNVHAFFHDAVGSSPQRLASLVPTRLDLRRRLLSSHGGAGQVGEVRVVWRLVEECPGEYPK